MYDCVSLAIQDRIELGKDRSHARCVVNPALVRLEHREQILFSYELDLEAVTGFLSVGPEDLERPPIVSRHEQVVSITVLEVTFETREVLLHHTAHRIIGRVTPAVERNVNQRFNRLTSLNQIGRASCRERG